MLEEVDYIDPLARLSKIRNMKRGLIVRTVILKCLREAEGSGRTIKEISDKTNLSYGVILHHLRKLEQEKIVLRKGKETLQMVIDGSWPTANR